MTSVAKINNHLFHDNDKTVSAELGLILGCKSISGYVAQEAVKLYKAGRIKKIAISGGGRTFDFLPKALRDKMKEDGVQPNHPFEKEADFIKGFLLKNGVREDDIVCVERKSKNTGANIQNTLDTLNRYKTTLIIAPAYSQRRALGTYRRYLPSFDRTVSAIAVYPLGLTQDNWADTPAIKAIVEGEFAKTDPNNQTDSSYIQIGYCVDVDQAAEERNLKSMNQADSKCVALKASTAMAKSLTP